MMGLKGLIDKLSGKSQINVPDEKEDALYILKKVLIGHSVKKISDNELMTDNNYVLKFEGNEGCGGCSNGWYFIKQLNEYNNIITNVELSETELHNDEYEYRYEIFVYTNNDRVRLLRCDGDDGNGYYGSGYWITVNLEGEYNEKN